MGVARFFLGTEGHFQLPPPSGLIYNSTNQKLFTVCRGSTTQPSMQESFLLSITLHVVNSDINDILS